MKSKLGQGATEYLVLLAVVLVIALVAIALLMGNLGESMDKRAAASTTALMSSYPIAFVEPPTAWASASQLHKEDNQTNVYFQMVNSGTHPITITKILANGYYIDTVWAWKEGGFRTLRELFHDIVPGETFVIGTKRLQWPFTWKDMLPSKGNFEFVKKGDTVGSPASLSPNASEQTCSYDKYLVVKNFGIEYEENIEGNIITKQQTWKELVVPCSAPFYWCC